MALLTLTVGLHGSEKAIAQGLLAPSIFDSAVESGFRNYAVFARGRDPVTVNRILDVAPTARFGNVNGQPVVLAGINLESTSANDLALRLRQRGVPAEIALGTSLTLDDGGAGGAVAGVSIVPGGGVAALPPPVVPPAANPTTVPRPAQLRYTTIIPIYGSAANTFVLEQVQRHIPTARLVDSRRGRYVLAGAYGDRNSAEATAFFLRSLGLDGRVAFF
ncbi:MAG TPA: hypothetical protein DCQ32_00360 [Cyanobacteria bacterium UBA8156]|jgi:hypothetical protein|nr:hypothetical protein [Cyanobacteria bacterium UBA8156]